MRRFQVETAPFEVLEKGFDTPARAAPTASGKVVQKIGRPRCQTNISIPLHQAALPNPFPSNHPPDTR